jgi:uncharacterized protein (TIGR02646 family)
MRPIDRGENNKPFSKYQQAKPDLIARLGYYCSYCEMRLPAGLGVDHVRPKSLHPELLLEWSNFLLACCICNPTKNNKEVSLSDYLWPDTDNTFLAFIYSEGGIITINPELKDKHRKQAQKLLELVGLQESQENNLDGSDPRWIERLEVWQIAHDLLKKLNAKNDKDLEDCILVLAHRSGCWSIWMTVFKDHSDMLNRLIDKFKGTCKDCFDPEGRPIPRRG